MPRMKRAVTIPIAVATAIAMAAAVAAAVAAARKYVAAVLTDMLEPTVHAGNEVTSLSAVFVAAERRRHTGAGEAPAVTVTDRTTGRSCVCYQTASVQASGWRLSETTLRRPALWNYRGAGSAILAARQTLWIQVQRPIFPFDRSPKNGVAESRKWVGRSRAKTDSHLAPLAPVARRTRLSREAPNPQTRAVQNYLRKTFATMS